MLTRIERPNQTTHKSRIVLCHPGLGNLDPLGAAARLRPPPAIFTCFATHKPQQMRPCLPQRTQIHFPQAFHKRFGVVQIGRKALDPIKRTASRIVGRNGPDVRLKP